MFNVRCFHQTKTKTPNINIELRIFKAANLLVYEQWILFTDGYRPHRRNNYVRGMVVRCDQVSARLDL